MKLKLILAAGIVAGVAAAARRRNQRTAGNSETWAAATDPVRPSES